MDLEKLTIIQLLQLIKDTRQFKNLSEKEIEVMVYSRRPLELVLFVQHLLSTDQVTIL